jgi:hypothetical protein
VAPAPAPASVRPERLAQPLVARVPSPALRPVSREKVVNIGARIVRHSRYVVFQLAEVAVPRLLFADILRRIDRLRGPPMATA